MNPVRPAAIVPWRAVALYVTLTCAATWSSYLPCLLLGRARLPSVFAALLLLFGSLAPALVSFVICRWVTNEPWRDRVGLGLFRGFRSRSRESGAGHGRSTLRYCLVAIGTMVAFCAALIVVEKFLIGLHFDFSLSAYLDELGLSSGLFWVPLLLKVLLPFTVLAIEIGWRGWLYPSLLPLGRFRAHLLTGLLWALWLAPFSLAGSFYPDVISWLAMVLMVIPCTLLTVFLGTLRELSDSVLPAAYGMAAFNAMTTLEIAAGYVPDGFSASWLYGTWGVISIILALVIIDVARHRIVMPSGDDLPPTAEGA